MQQRLIGSIRGMSKNGILTIRSSFWYVACSDISHSANTALMDADSNSGGMSVR